MTIDLGDGMTNATRKKPSQRELSDSISLIYSEIDAYSLLSTGAITPTSPGGVDNGLHVHLECASFIETDHTLREKHGRRS